MAASSKFHEGIQECLGGKIKFHTFSWSGANKHAARNAAVLELAKHIDSVAQQDNHSPHFLIGHSHGGNIALYALRSASCHERLSGVVCMNTPFVCVQRRDTTRLFFLIGAFIFAWVTMLTIIYGVSSFAHIAEAAGWTQVFRALPWWEQALIGVSIYAVGMGVSYYFKYGYFKYGRRVLSLYKRGLERSSKWSLAKREALFQEVGLPNFTVPVLTIRSTGDEVIGAVALSTILANAPFTVLHPWSMTALFGVFFTAQWTGWLPSLIEFYRTDEVRIIEASSFLSGPRMVECFMSSGIYLLAAITIILVAALSLAPLFRLAPLGLGWKHLVNSLFVKLSFTLVPVTNARIEYLELDPRIGEFFKLSHSRIYDQPNAIKAITDWISVRSAEFRPKSAQRSCPSTSK